MNFMDIARTLLAKGFDSETHKILSWFSILDIDCFGRAIALEAGNNAFVIEKEPE
jgi:hypothetical protein